MSDVQQILFSASPNSDDDIRLVANGWFRYAKHLRSGTIESANQGARESYLGNALIANASMPAGVNRMLEMCPNVEAYAIMFRVFNSNGNHTIWQLNIASGTFTLVMQNSLLSFSTIDYGWSMFVNNNILYWTNGGFISYIGSNFSEPKQIDITQGILFSAGATSKYITITRRTFDFIKWPPPFGPVATYITDATKETNFLWGKLYKFRYRYIYINNEESALSPGSRLALPVTGDYAQGRDFSNTQDDNAINVVINTGPDIVAKIEILVSVNNGPYNVYEQIDKALDGIANNTTYTSVYNGNEYLVPVDIVQRNYDNVPQRSRNMVMTPDRKIAFGDYVEGYNKIDINATLSAVPSEITGKEFPITGGYYGTFPAAGGFPNESFITTGNPAGTDVYPQVGDTMVFIAGVSVPDQVVTITLTQDDVDQINAQVTAALREDEFLTLVGDYISTALGIPNGVLLTANGVRTYYWPLVQIFSNLINAFTDVNISYYSGITGGTYRLSDPRLGLFKGAIHEYGIQYYDRANRDGTVLATPVQSLYVPFDTEQSKTDFQNANDPYVIFARMTIPIPGLNDLNRPPDWATHWQIVKRRIPVLSFRETTGLVINNAPEPGLLRIELDDFHAQNNAFYFHNIKVGDVVRLIREGTSTSTIGPYIGEYVELQVVKYDPAASPGGTIWVPAFDSTGIVVNSTGFLLQIYTPGKLDENALWHEIGEEYLVLNPHTTTRLHAGSILTGTATGLVTGSPNFNLEARFFTNGGNFNYLIGRTFNITADVAYTGTITNAVFNPATQVTAITASANFTGVQGFGAITIDLSQTLTLPGIVNMVYGDVYTRTRIMRATHNYTTGLLRFYTIDDFNYSDFYPSNVNSEGRIALELADARQIRQKATIIHGGAFVDNTEINNLCRFDNTDINAVLAMDEQYGPINKMVVIGYTLKCIQDRKENSVYIRNTFGTLPDGSATAGFNSDKTFGAWNQMKTGFGTIHPWSVQVADGNLIYYDHLSGTIVRSSNNGQVSLGEGKYKYKKRIRDFKVAVDTAGIVNSWVTSMLDEENGEYTITFFDTRTPSVGTQGLVFRYDKDEWSHEVSYAVFFAGNLGEYLVSTPAALATVYRHGTGAMNTFYGTIYASQMAFCWNVDPLLLKRPLRIGLRTDREWTLTSFVTEANASYPAQDTEIIAGQWELLEGYYWASFLNDKNNVVPEIPALATTQLALFNGRQLRAYAATGLLTFTPSTGLKVKILSLTILSQISDPGI